MNGWRKFFAVSCSHGSYLDDECRRFVLRFLDRWKPHTVAHLGDWVDTRAFRRGAAGTSDQSANVREDMTSGQKFLNEMFEAPGVQRRLLFAGNHEHRIYEVADDLDAVRAEAAQMILSSWEAYAKKWKCDGGLIPYDIEDGWRELGSDCVLGHGYMIGKNAVAAHAEMHGRKVIFGHLHRVEARPGETMHESRGYCCGWLGNRIGYERRRRATLAWGNGVAFGVYKPNGQTVVTLCERPAIGEWALPI
jgi:predicted phosphodiesterase